MTRYVGEIQTWQMHLKHTRKTLGAIYDSLRPRGRGDSGSMRHDFAFVGYVEPSELEARLVELNKSWRER